jgi:hypothetical protein
VAASLIGKIIDQDNYEFTKTLEAELTAGADLGGHH